MKKILAIVLCLMMCCAGMRVRNRDGDFRKQHEPDLGSHRSVPG